MTVCAELAIDRPLRSSGFPTISQTTARRPPRRRSDVHMSRKRPQSNDDRHTDPLDALLAVLNETAVARRKMQEVAQPLRDIVDMADSLQSMLQTVNQNVTMRVLENAHELQLVQQEYQQQSASAGAGCSSSGPQALPPSPAVAGGGAAGAIGAVGGSVHLYPHISQGVLPLNYPDARLSSAHMPPPPPRRQPLLQAAAAGGGRSGTSTTTTDALSAAGPPLGGAPHESLLGGPPGGGRDGTPSSTIAEASEEGGADD